MRDVLEMLAAPWFAIIDLALAAPTAAIASASMAGVAVVVVLLMVA